MSMATIKGIVAWGALVCVVGSTYWVLTSADRMRIAENEYNYVRKQALLHRLEALPEEEEAIRQKLDELTAEATSRFLYAGDDNTIRSLIQRDLRNLAGNEIKLSSMRLLGRTRGEGPLASSSVQIKFSSSHEGFVSFLQSLEAWEPLLKVRHLSVRVRQASTATTAAELAVVMEVTGFRRVKKAES